MIMCPLSKPGEYLAGQYVGDGVAGSTDHQVPALGRREHRRGPEGETLPRQAGQRGHPRPQLRLETLPQLALKVTLRARELLLHHTFHFNKKA